MSQVDSKQVQRMFQAHLDAQTKKFDDREFWTNLRATHRAKFGLPEQDLAVADYRNHVERLAASARVTAFDEMIAELSKKLHTEDINMLLPVLRRAHIKLSGGDVMVDGQFLEIFPAIAFELNVTKKPRTTDNVHPIANAKKPVNKPVVDSRKAEAAEAKAA